MSVSDNFQPLVALVAEVPMRLVSMVTHMHVQKPVYMCIQLKIKNKSFRSLLHFVPYKRAIKIHELWTGNFHLNISVPSW